jgi:hypothetical protein
MKLGIGGRKTLRRNHLREQQIGMAFTCRGERGSLSRRPPAASGCPTAIRHGIPALRPEAQGQRRALLHSPIFRLFADDPAAIVRTQEIADRCRFSLAEIRYRYPSEHMPNGMTSADWLRHLTFEGAHERYGNGIPTDVADQLEKELKIIEALDYPGYFLTMQEIVRFCREKGILCQTRLRGKFGGLLLPHVTAVDPAKVNLLFERFISKKGRSLPISISTSSMISAKKSSSMFMKSTAATVRQWWLMSSDIVPVPRCATWARL